MIEFGKSLRAARETKGYSIGQLAEMTRMAPATVLELESENFSRIAAPIYGRGFVKLYCEAVGVDPRPYVDEFMELYNGNRQTDIRERPSRISRPEPSEAPTVPSDDVVAAEPPMQEQVLPTVHTPEPTPDLFNQPAECRPDAEPVRESPQEPPLSRYAAPMRQKESAFDLHAYLRLALLAAAVLVVLSLLGFGLRAVYRATTRPTSAEPAEEALFAKDEPPPQQPASPTPPSAKVARTPQKIPDLYID